MYSFKNCRTLIYVYNWFSCICLASTSRVTTTTSVVILPNYSGSLTSNSPTFIRQGESSGYYYYQAIQVLVSMTGTYILTSTSSMDTYGYLYSYSFNPSYPSQYLLASNDDGNGNRQFRIDSQLQRGSIYILVVTTYTSREQGSYYVTAVGPASVSLSSMTVVTSKCMLFAFTFSVYVVDFTLDLMKCF